MKQFLLLLLLSLSFISPSFSIPVEHVPLPVVNTVSQTVYVTKTGTKYHLGNCSYLRQSKIKTTKSEAVNSGYSACKVCKP